MKRFLTTLLLIVSLASGAMAQDVRWAGTWATAAEPTGKSDMPRTTTLTDCSLRQVVHVSLGGQSLRLRFSNEFGSGPVEIQSVYLADARDSSDIDVRSARYLTFGGRRDAVIEPGAMLVSDVLTYNLRPLQRLSVTICYGQAPEFATSHRGSRTTSYIMPGTSKPKRPFVTSERLEHWYNLTAIEVPTAANVVAVLGNSITDGRGSTTNLQNRWTDVMAEALQGRVGVLNLGIGGNAVVRGGLSQPALVRFDRDILGQQGITHLIVFEGVNDIGGSRHAEQTARELIDAYKEFIRKAHERGIRVYGATITPFGGSDYWSLFHEATRQAVNEWIRTSGEWDGVIDFDQLMRDPDAPQRLRPAWQSDWLHPNAEGYRAMGQWAAERF